MWVYEVSVYRGVRCGGYRGNGYGDVVPVPGYCAHPPCPVYHHCALYHPLYHHCALYHPLYPPLHHYTGYWDPLHHYTGYWDPLNPAETTVPPTAVTTVPPPLCLCVLLLSGFGCLRVLLLSGLVVFDTTGGLSGLRFRRSVDAVPLRLWVRS